MKAILGFCIFTACLAVGVRADNASAKTTSDKSADVSVQASSDFRVAILDASRPTLERAALHEAFASALSTSMSKQCGGTVNVKCTEVDAFTLGFDMKTGAYDAALVIGASVPAVLKTDDFEIIRAMSQAGSPSKILYMVIPMGDQGLEKMVASSFPEVLSSSKFQNAVVHADTIKVNVDAIKKASQENVADSTR
jgi:hypothetical protein